MDNIDSLDQLNAVKGFKIVHLNIRSIVKKIDQVRILLENTPIDIVTFSETWLKSHLHSALFDISGYKLLRQDRLSKKKSGKRGRGLMTYVRDSHSSLCEELEDLNTSNENIEAQWTLIHRPHCKNIVIGNLYRPPTGDLVKTFNYLDECLGSINLSKVNLFLVGDLNINLLDKTSDAYKKANFFFQSNGLTQYINTSTRNTEKNNSLIDEALSNSKFVSQAGVIEIHVSDHQPDYIIHKKKRDKRDSVEFKGRSYRNFDKGAFQMNLLEKDWNEFYNLDSPKLAWDLMQKHITSVLDEMCPIRTFRIKNYRPDWMSNELIEQIKDRDYFFKKAKRVGHSDVWNIAKFLRNVTNFNIRSAKREFILNELKENEDNAKKFWKVIRKVVPTNKSSSRQDILLKDNGEKIDKGQVATFINNYFINVGNLGPSTHTTSNADSETTPTKVMKPKLKEFDRLLEREILKVIREINVSKSSGIENLSSKVLKEAFTTLLPQLTFLYNLSLSSAIFPDQWKKALIIPIPKTGNLTKVQNYRPISLLPLPGKILEKLVHAQITRYLDENSLLTEKQHGFRKSHSTVHSVSQFVNYVNANLDVRRTTLAAFIDFRKAFDCVQHDILLEKLDGAGLHQSVVQWVRSYLNNRKQRVLANNVYSNFQTITQGVPQGSVLGPLFYILYANDLADLFVNCEVALYADDTVLYTANDSFESSATSVEKDLERLGRWCDRNGIMVNTSKTKLMVFGSKTTVDNLPPYSIAYNDLPLLSLTSYKYLGITLDRQLNYNLHIKGVIASVSAKLKQFQRMRSFLSVKAAVMVYKGMLLPIIEYGDVFLSAASKANRKKLQTLQNKGLRCALNKGLDVSSDDLHNEAGLLKLKYRREQRILNFIYDWSLDKDKLKTKPSGSVSTHSQDKRLLKLKKPITEKYKRSLAYRGPNKWNKLPVILHLAPSKPAFKTLIEKRMMLKSETSIHLNNSM